MSEYIVCVPGEFVSSDIIYPGTPEMGSLSSSEYTNGGLTIPSHGNSDSAHDDVPLEIHRQMSAYELFDAFPVLFPPAPDRFKFAKLLKSVSNAAFCGISGTHDSATPSAPLHNEARIKNLRNEARILQNKLTSHERRQVALSASLADARRAMNTCGVKLSHLEVAQAHEYSDHISSVIAGHKQELQHWQDWLYERGPEMITEYHDLKGDISEIISDMKTIALELVHLDPRRDWQKFFNQGLGSDFPICAPEDNELERLDERSGIPSPGNDSGIGVELEAITEGERVDVRAMNDRLASLSKETRKPVDIVELFDELEEDADLHGPAQEDPIDAWSNKSSSSITGQFRPAREDEDSTASSHDTEPDGCSLPEDPITYLSGINSDAAGDCKHEGNFKLYNDMQLPAFAQTAENGTIPIMGTILEELGPINFRDLRDVERVQTLNVPQRTGPGFGSTRLESPQPGFIARLVDQFRHSWWTNVARATKHDDESSSPTEVLTSENAPGAGGDNHCLGLDDIDWPNMTLWQGFRLAMYGAPTAFRREGEADERTLGLTQPSLVRALKVIRLLTAEPKEDMLPPPGRNWEYGGLNRLLILADEDVIDGYDLTCCDMDTQSLQDELDERFEERLALEDEIAAWTPGDWCPSVAQRRLHELTKTDDEEELYTPWEIRREPSGVRRPSGLRHELQFDE